ncbi:dipeptidase [Nitratireductor alexandrii]|uniref:dipeptidase n=1 Tax=Nitratireductor alexandrii TaxID=2448161 RepID=UPI000FDBF5C0|nr:membrane dipeptidase [Nitratireductor alexandrii]
MVRKALVVDCLEAAKPERVRFEEWRKGGLDCVHVTVATMHGARETLSLLGNWNRLLEDNSDLIALARSVDEIETISASGRTAVLFGFQDTTPLEDDIELVEVFYNLGIRIIQLTYNVQNRVASGCWETVDGGISKHFGANVVSDMNRLGMVVDISHCGERSSMEAIENSSRPVAVTHANPEEFIGTEIELNRRNKSTDLLRKLAANGGVIGLSPYPKILKGGSDCTLDTFIDMISWTVDKIGVDAVGFGTDYFMGWTVDRLKWARCGRFARESAVPITGLSRWPDWFQSPEDFPDIHAAMEKRGFSKAEVDKIAGENWIRLFRANFG